MNHILNDLHNVLYYTPLCSLTSKIYDLQDHKVNFYDNSIFLKSNEDILFIALQLTLRVDKKNVPLLNLLSTLINNIKCNNVKSYPKHVTSRVIQKMLRNVDLSYVDEKGFPRRLYILGTTRFDTCIYKGYKAFEKNGLRCVHLESLSFSDILGILKDAKKLINNHHLDGYKIEVSIFMVKWLHNL